MYFVLVKEKKELIQLEVLNITQGFSQYNSYSVVLGEKNGNRRLPIVIGAVEAQSILIAKENIPSKRPLTHDLIKTMFGKFDVMPLEVVINHLLDGVYYAIITVVYDGYVIDIDSRTSDAIAIALRCNIPIFIHKDILEDVAITFLKSEDEIISISENPEEEYLLQKQSSFSQYSVVELENLLKEALQNEDYEKAAKIRDELKRK